MFWAGLVEFSVVDTHAEFAIGLGDDDQVSQPLGVDNLLNEASLHHLPHLVVDEVLPFRGLMSDLLVEQVAHWGARRYCARSPP